MQSQYTRAGMGTIEERDNLKALPVRQYLDTTVVPILLQAMSEVANERPQYPIDFIINYLRENNPEKQDPQGNARGPGGKSVRSTKSKAPSAIGKK